MFNPNPQKVRPLRFDGTVSFNCCGFQHELSISWGDTFRCPICKIRYYLTSISVNIIEEGDVFPEGTIVVARESFEAKNSGIPLQVEKGQRYKVHYDRYGVLNMIEGEVAIEYPSPVQGCPDRVLLAVVPKDILEVEDEGIGSEENRNQIG